MIARSCRIPLALLLAACGIAAAAAVSSTPDEQPASEPAIRLGQQRIWIEPGRDLPGRRASLVLHAPAKCAPDETIVIDCTIESADTRDECSVQLTVRAQNGEPLHRGAIDCALEKGSNPCRFSWQPEEIPPGVYTARVEVLDTPEGSLAARELIVRKLAAGLLEQSFDEADRKTRALREHLDSLASQGTRPPYANLRVAIAEDVLAPMRTAYAGGDWRRAEALADYASSTCDAVRSSLTFGGFAPATVEPVPRPNLVGLEMHDGVFYAEGRPVVLIGAQANTAEDIRRLDRYGFNFAVCSLTPGETELGLETSSPSRQRLDTLFEEALECNISVICHLSPGGDAMANEIDLGDPSSRHAIERHLQTAAPYLANQPMLGGLCLAREPRFRFEDINARDGFARHMRAQFPDLDTLNDIWRSRFVTFSDIRLPWEFADIDEDDRPSYLARHAYQYDWQTYLQRLSTEFLGWMRMGVMDAAPNIPAFVAAGDAVFDVGESKSGVDREALGALMDAAACTASATQSHDVFAIGYPYPAIYHTLLHSMSPDKPVLDTELELTTNTSPYAPARYGFVYTALWESVMAGANALSVTIAPDPLSDNPGPAKGLFDLPECLEAAATACLDMNRLGEVVVAFQQAPADVAILWSMPSKILQDGEPYLRSLAYAYEGCSFYGRNVRFVTERQCAQGALADVSILVIPDMLSMTEACFLAIDRFIQEQGTVIRMGQPIPYDLRGVSRQSVLSSTPNTFLLRRADSPKRYLDAMDAACSMAELEPRTRPVSAHGYPLDGVVCRTARIGADEYLYLVNMRTERVFAHLENGPREGHDLLRARDIAFPSAIDPLTPMLIRLEPEPATPIEPPAEDEGVPTATVGPIPPPPEPPPRPYNVPERRRGIRPKYPPKERSSDWELYR